MWQRTWNPGMDPQAAKQRFSQAVYPVYRKTRRRRHRMCPLFNKLCRCHTPLDVWADEVEDVPPGSSFSNGTNGSLWSTFRRWILDWIIGLGYWILLLKSLKNVVGLPLERLPPDILPALSDFISQCNTGQQFCCSPNMFSGFVSYFCIFVMCWRSTRKALNMPLHDALT